MQTKRGCRAVVSNANLVFLVRLCANITDAYLEPVMAGFDLHSELLSSHTCSSCFISPLFTCNEPFQRCCRGAKTESLETFMEWACVHQPLCAHTYTWSLWVNASSLVLDPLLWPPNPAPFLPSPCPSAELSAFIFNSFTFMLLVHV